MEPSWFKQFRCPFDRPLDEIHGLTIVAAKMFKLGAPCCIEGPSTFFSNLFQQVEHAVQFQVGLLLGLPMLSDQDGHQYINEINITRSMLVRFPREALALIKIAAH